MSVLSLVAHFEVMSSSPRSATAASPLVEVRGSSLPRDAPYCRNLGTSKLVPSRLALLCPTRRSRVRNSPLVTPTLSSVEVLGSSPPSVAPPLSHFEVKGSSQCSVATTSSKVEVLGSSPPSITINRSTRAVRGSIPAAVAPILFHQHTYVRDRLDDHVEQAAAAFQKSSTWGDFI